MLEQSSLAGGDLILTRREDRERRPERKVRFDVCQKIRKVMMERQVEQKEYGRPYVNFRTLNLIIQEENLGKTALANVLKSGPEIFRKHYLCRMLDKFYVVFFQNIMRFYINMHRIYEKKEENLHSRA